MIFEVPQQPTETTTPYTGPTLGNARSLESLKAQARTALETIEAAFEGAGAANIWPDVKESRLIGGKFPERVHAAYHIRRVTHFHGWAQRCPGEQSLFLLGAQLDDYIDDLAGFIRDTAHLQTCARRASGWIDFATKVDKALEELVEASRAIEWRARALLALAPEEQATELERGKEENEILKRQRDTARSEAQKNRRRAKSAEMIDT